MDNEIKSTAPKPFIFVLMPFDETFNDIYKFGIKGAAEEVGAYAERVDEQIYDGVILERIFNQISKADVIVADMTGRNPNVFYEVGYAHALGKIVLLLTQKAEDIPFDLIHRPHIIYGGKIETLRSKLAERLIWAINESKRLGRQISERFLVSINGTEIPEASMSHEIPVLKVEGYSVLSVSVRNGSLETTPKVTHVYLFTSADSGLSLYSNDLYMDRYENPNVFRRLDSIESTTLDSSDGLAKQFRLEDGNTPIRIPSLPPGAVEQFSIYIEPKDDELLKLRIHSSVNFYDFPFKLELKREVMRGSIK